MTSDEVAGLLEQYRSGIEAELHLLNELASVATRQREVSQTSDLSAFNVASDARDRIMRSLVTIEENLRLCRQTLAEHRHLAIRLNGYEDVAKKHRDAVKLVNEILAADQQSVTELANAELARRSAVAGLEKGETTLAAYRRVLSPPVASAKLVDKRG